MRRAGSWVLAVLAAVVLTGCVAVAYADRTVFRADGFSDRAAASLRREPVRAAVAARVADAAIGAQPDLVAIRPLVVAAAEGIVGTDAFRSLVRGAARDVHRSVFDRDAVTVTLTVGDAGILVAQALQELRPEPARQLPAGLGVRLAAIVDAPGTTALRATERVEQVRRALPFGFALALGLALAAFAAGRSRRVVAGRLGVSIAVVAGLAAALARFPSLAISGDSAALRGVLATWLDPLAIWCLALSAAGVLTAMAAASVVRPVAVGSALRRLSNAIAFVPLDPRRRALRAVALIAFGALVVLEPRATLELATRAGGALIVLAGASEVLRLAAGPAAPHPARRRGVGRSARIAAVAALLTAAVAAAGALAATSIDVAPRVGRCNGHAALCDRRLDEVAFVGTHNSMAADREPGWLFAAQDAGIEAQLQEGVRTLMIDTHYGFATARGVATDLTDESTSRAKVVDELSEEFLATAERLRKRIGYRGGGTREVFLCHAFCEVGATRALDALTVVHRFLVTHPEEVVILSIEDDTTAADTAAVIRASGLIGEVYRGPAGRPWPTLRDMIERDERVLVLAENHGGAEPWMHRQPVVAQETPYHFATPAELGAPPGCAPNRGGTTGSLFLVNHWVDTSPAPRLSIAQLVNARAFVDARLALCRTARRPWPNILAVDFYRQGDVFAVVDALNGIG